MQLCQLGVAVLLAGADLLVENLGQLLDRLSRPRRNLGRMQVVLGRQFRNRLMALDRLKCDLGFELAGFRHVTAFAAPWTRRATECTVVRKFQSQSS